MLPIPKPPLTHRQKAIALRVAGLADFVQILLIPALAPGLVADEVIDVIVAIVLSAVCGFKWQFLAAFLIELVPGLGLLPTWSAVVLTLPSVPDGAYNPDFDPAQHVTATDPSTGNAAPTERRPARSHPPITVSAVAVPPVQSPPVQPNR